MVDIAAKALCTVGPVAIKPLTAVIYRSNDQELCRLAFNILKNIDNDAARRMLEAQLNDLRRYRNSAAVVLGKIGDARAIEPLIMAMKNRSWDQSFCDTVIAALAAIGPSAVPALSRHLQPLEWEMRLRNRVGPNAMPYSHYYVHVLKNENLAALVARTLARIGDTRGIDALDAACADIQKQRDSCKGQKEEHLIHIDPSVEKSIVSGRDQLIAQRHRQPTVKAQSN